MIPPFQSISHDLTMGQTPRVWSLLITVFGDLAQGEDTRISGVLLSRMTGAIGIKPEANRVAIHRLRKDGWIVSHRSGRKSEYALTEMGLSRSAQATPRIYSKVQAAEDAWLVASDTITSDAHPLGANLYMSPRPVVGTGSLCTLITPDTSIPNWISEQVCGSETVALAHDTEVRLKAAQETLEGVEDFAPLEVAVLRVLVVHAWRRVILRTPTLPDFVFPLGWCGPSCRLLAGRLLEQLKKPNLADLENST